MQFMNSSLASLTKNLGYTDEQLALVLCKKVYPYDYIDSQNRFKETELLLYHKFHSTLKDEYHDIYLKTDVFNLADIWTVFRKMSMKYYKLDSSHYVFASSLS
ncbi:14877_t:CDS:2 [Funneliformis geosporum]|uniref:14877_t:CDS:1 n=1 Tax=Funneliformis geosporum TaxID=1117311 RepID=A0A9W4SMS8_9GLOM|nr:14877_t:CDS:2 [Funneliformis geosporum]